MDTQIKDNSLIMEKEYQLKYYEVDFRMVLKPSALLNFMQDIATVNADLHGFGYSFTHPKNYGWFLIKYHMEFDEYPQELDNMIIKTEPRGVHKILAYRDFEMWTSDNKKRLGRIQSHWMMVDLENKSVLPLSKILGEMMPPYEKRDSDMDFVKVLPPENFDYEKQFEIRYDDIDINQHVNNSNYIVWAFEALPFDFKSTRKLKTFDIVYKKEIAIGNNVLSKAKIDENISAHVLINASTGEDLCLIKAAWV